MRVPAVLFFSWRTLGLDRGVLRKGGTGTHMSQLLAIIPFIQHNDHGQGLAEYALILTLIAMVSVIALIFMGTQVSTMLHTVGLSV